MVDPHEDCSMPPHPRDDEVMVYDGRDCLGTRAVTPGCGWNAHLVDGRDLGRFPTRQAASQAILEAARIRK